jgi:hypothetical protein
LSWRSGFTRGCRCRAGGWQPGGGQDTGRDGEHGCLDREAGTGPEDSHDDPGERRGRDPGRRCSAADQRIRRRELRTGNDIGQQRGAHRAEEAIRAAVRTRHGEQQAE